eukprot:4491120-Alexandrium_andersonii.AAC.1
MGLPAGGAHALSSSQVLLPPCSAPTPQEPPPVAAPPAAPAPGAPSAGAPASGRDPRSHLSEALST